MEIVGDGEDENRPAARPPGAESEANNEHKEPVPGGGGGIPQNFKIMLGVVVAFALAALLWPTEDDGQTKGRPSGRSISVSASDVAGDWPLTVPSGEVRCSVERFGRVDRPIVTFVAPSGRVYGLNGAAMGVGGYPDIDLIRAVTYPMGPDTPIPGNVQPLIEQGLRLCGER